MPVELDILGDSLQSSFQKDNTLLRDEDDPFYHYLISTKAATNLDIIRKSAIKDSIHDSTANTINEYQTRLSRLEDLANSLNFSAESKLKQKYDSYVEDQKTRRYSVDFDMPAEGSMDSEDIASGMESREEDDSLRNLRQRLMGKRRDSFEGENESFDKQMQIQDDLQKELVQDMSQLVTGLKQGAEAFQNALEHDSTVLKAAEIGLHVTSRSLSTLGSNLKKYHKEKIGFFMKLGLLSFVILGLLITYLVIKVFPDL
ncbi:protein transport protein USE1 [Kluyveromyces marxianus]|uniref:Protein transport protein USE1 n=2 Tax=Kluyveromyces marxianus TaxID=4911 RepID=W0T752_KLUMD|nr:protein transport protein USE1 [Kluyveromyces marxianus DMKU3-1042]QGN14605.1 protein transport protein USE1 [Kluyveromyces marxianus]BAO38868.1 protein transport protein USE1 [Kluyveromyces marxianus DMKU3-1042]